MTKTTACAIACVIAGTIVFGCGGGGGGGSAAGGGGGNIPPAPDPVCSGLVAQEPSRPPVGGGDPDLIIPPSSVERTADVGVRMHTNHIILGGSATNRQGPSSGLTPAKVNTAYGGAGGGTGAIAIVDAFDYPTALNDFNFFAAQFGLPTEISIDETLGTNLVFQKVYAAGSAPPTDGSWSQEMALDIEWAHAMAPGAKIYLVEAASSNTTDIMAAVGVAKGLPGVTQVSMSFGGTEQACNFVNYDPLFVQSGVVFFAATGDTAGERDYPALSKNVVAVGGTTLNVDSSGNWVSEKVWNGTGCGPSAFEPRPTFQNPEQQIVRGFRGACDVAAVGNPKTGVAIYDSFKFNNVQGWFVVGGTSVATPIVAGIANSAGVSFTGSQTFNAKLYAGIGTTAFHDVTVGTSGSFGAAVGWDVPSGCGAPNSLATYLATP